MFYTIYKTTNLINNKIYIGKHKTKNINDLYYGSGILIAEAIEKYGIENFTKEILYIFDNEEEMNQKEAELVTEEFCLREDTYNLCPGGKGGWGYIHQNNLCDYSKYGKIGAERLRSLLKDEKYFEIFSKNKSENWRKYYERGGKAPMQDKKHSDKTKRKISEAKMGNTSTSGRKWINNKEKEILVEVDSLDEYYQKGYRLGRLTLR